MTEEITQVCIDCGFVANHLTMLKRYGAKSIQPVNPGSFGVWEGECGCCGETKVVTSIRDFYYPAQRALKFVKNYITKGKDV